MIEYREGYKYQLVKPHELWIGIRPAVAITDDFISLDVDGHMIIHAGYAWDGPSGPTFDTPAFMRGSLVHDAGYQLMRNKHLPESDKEYFDRLLFDVCRSAGMSSPRAWYVYKAVQAFGLSAVRETRPILTAP